MQSLYEAVCSCLTSQLGLPVKLGGTLFGAAGPEDQSFAWPKFAPLDVAVVAVLVLMILILLAWVSRLLFLEKDAEDDLEFMRAVMSRNPRASLENGNNHTMTRLSRSALRFLAFAGAAGCIAAIVSLLNVFH